MLWWEQLLKNAPQGKVWYGLHFYPGVAEYRPDGEEMHRVYLNSDALRAMDPSFTGKPLYVMHVDTDDIPRTTDEARKDADGWVIESFYNKADGKHWAKFMTLTAAADSAIARKFGLSNAYRVTQSVPGSGQWNGVDYDQQIKNGQYEHLALVPNPRYESMILTPDEFKEYCERKLTEIERIANDNGKGSAVKLKFWERKQVEKVENAGDLAQLEIELPKSKRVVSIMTLVNAVDCEPGKPVMANMEHHLQMGEKTMSLNDFLQEHKKQGEALANYQSEDPKLKNEEDDEEDEDEKKKKENAEDDEDDTKENALEDEAEAEETRRNALEVERKKKAKKAADKKKADELRNARDTDDTEEPQVLRLPGDAMAEGKLRYGSGK